MSKANHRDLRNDLQLICCGRGKMGEQQMEKARLAAQEERRACTCVRCGWADRQAEGESCTVVYRAGLNLMGQAAQKLDKPKSTTRSPRWVLSLSTSASEEVPLGCKE